MYHDLFGTEEMRAVFSDEALVKQWLRVEVALAEAEAKNGVIPESAAKAIKKAATMDNLDWDTLQRLDEATGRLEAQFGSTVGTLAPFGPGSKEVARYLSKKDIDSLMKPENYIGSATQIVDRAVTQARATMK